jgi:hypothetical protein
MHNNPWVQGISFIVIGALLGLLITTWTTKSKEPTFYVEPIPAIVVDQNNINKAPIEVINRRTRKPITRSILSATFYFFNQGELTILDRDVYNKPLRVRLNNKDARILDFRILKISREETGIALQTDSTNNQINISFEALEENDGFTAQVIYEGELNTRPVIRGGIEGVTKFKSQLEPPLHFKYRNHLFIGAALINVVFVFLVSFIPRRKILFILFAISTVLFGIAATFFFTTSEKGNSTYPETLKVNQFDQWATEVESMEEWLKDMVKKTEQN